MMSTVIVVGVQQLPEPSRKWTLDGETISSENLD